MFQSARIKLTLWYLAIIMAISIFFSIAFYKVSTREIRRIIHRVEFFQEQEDNRLFPPPSRFFISRAPSLEVLQATEKRLQIILIGINGVILLLAGGASYFLAGRTLRPIKLMIDEQNQFVSDASHELRTPLATMRAEMEGSLLEKKISDKRARELIKSNLEELTTLQNLTNNLLRLAEIPVNGKPLENVSLLGIIKTSTKKIAPLAKRKQIAVEIKVKDAVLPADKNSLIELFVILFDNAIKYSPKNSIIHVASEQTQRSVKISVSDQGVGISEKDLSHIFERFYRADKSRSEVGGYGLGLSIAKKIVETHKGTIAVKSKVKEGSVFTLEFPLSNS